MTALLRLFLAILALPFRATPAIGVELELYDADAEQPAAAPTPFRTHLKLTAEQKTALEDRIDRRLCEISAEMGLDDGGGVKDGSWMDIRLKNQAVYDNDLEWRKQVYGGVFLTSNLSRGVTRRFTREMAAKVSDDMLGTTPFFGAVKRLNGADSALARAVEEFSQIEIESSNVPAALREAQRSALIRGEAVVKVRHVEDSTFFRGEATVLVDEGGNPIKTTSGQYVFEDDDFAPDPNVEGMNRLKKDPTFEMADGQFQYVYFPDLMQETIRKQRLEAHVLDSRSFLCPLTAPSLHDADMVAQLMDQTIEQLTAAYGPYDEFAAYCTERTSGEQQPRTTQGETPEGADSTEINRVRIAECYIRFDADGDGFEEEIFVVYDRRAKRAVFYDYLDNHFAKRPFECIVGVETVANRWYGIGIIRMLWDQNLYADIQFNRINNKDSREASITFADEMAVKEWKGNGPIEFGTNKIYRVEAGYEPKGRPPIWRQNLNEVSDLGMELMTITVQDMTTSFGVISAKDASAADLNNSRTATGILNLERTANILTRYTEIAQQIGIEALLRQAVVIALEHMPPMKMFFSKDGEVLHTLNKQEARAIEKDVRLFLTRARSSESLAISAQALQIAKDYHAMLAQDPRPLMYLRSLYASQLKALEIADADEMLPVVDEAYIAKWQAERAAAVKAQSEAENKPPQESLSYKDVPPSVRAQMEQASGYQPAPPQERIAAMADAKPAPKKEAA